MVSICDLAEALKKAIAIFSVLADSKSNIQKRRIGNRGIFELLSPLCAFASKAHELAFHEGRICDYCPMTCGWKNEGQPCYNRTSSYSRYIFAEHPEEAMRHISAVLAEAQHRFKAVSKVALSNEKP